MQVTETKAEGLRHEFTIVLPAHEIDEKLDARLEEVGRTVKISGFRPGKVPARLLKQRFGHEVLGEVIERAVNDSSQQAIMERDLRPAMQPKVEITSYEDGSDLEYRLEVEVLPQFDLPDLSKIELERPVVEVPEQEVDDSLKRVAENYAETKPLEKARGAESGDVLVIDFVGKIDGEAFPGGSATDHHLQLGSNSFVAGFEEQLVGLKPGDHAEVKIRFPDEYVNDKLSGRDAVFEVDVKEIRERVPVAVDEELAKMVGMESLDALRSAVRHQLEGEYSGIVHGRLKREILDKLADLYDFDVPPGMLDLEFQSIWQQIQHGKEHGHLDEEDKNKSDEELEADYRAIAERRVRLGLLLSELGRANNIQVSQDEITRAVLEQARSMPGQENQVMEYYKNNPEALANVRAPIFEDKVINFIIEMAKVSERKVSPQELLELASDAGEEGGSKAAAESKTKAKPKTKKKAAKKTAKKTASKPADGD